ncbi:MAG TPA: GNAT family N-acetyltransferase [Anaerolineales bacterium]|nr:GNAT family N-acetyltransferase [Anaerolineales bacterium]
MKPSPDSNNFEIQHNPTASRFEVQVSDHVAVLEYQMNGHNMVITHTLVPEALEGQGIGSRLARTGLEYAKEHSYHVVALCSFVDSYIRRHPEYQSLINQ